MKPVSKFFSWTKRLEWEDLCRPGVRRRIYTANVVKLKFCNYSQHFFFRFQVHLWPLIHTNNDDDVTQSKSQWSVRTPGGSETCGANCSNQALEYVNRLPTVPSGSNQGAWWSMPTELVPFTSGGCFMSHFHTSNAHWLEWQKDAVAPWGQNAIPTLLHLLTFCTTIERIHTGWT